MIDILSPTCSQLLFLATHCVIQSNAEWSMWPFQDAAAVMPVIDGCGEFKEKMKNGWQSNGMKWRHITDTPQFISFSNQILLREGLLCTVHSKLPPGLRKRSFLLNFHWIITCLKVLVNENSLLCLLRWEKVPLAATSELKLVPIFWPFQASCCTSNKMTPNFNSYILNSKN